MRQPEQRSAGVLAGGLRSPMHLGASQPAAGDGGAASKGWPGLLLCCLFFLLVTPCLALDRGAFTFTRYDLRVGLSLQQQAMEVSGRVTLRNDSPTPQRALALQISSTLSWASIKLDGKPAAYVSQPYTTDIDHTGSVSEAIVSLPGEIAPKSTVELEVAYAGTIPLDATRLTRIGAPAQIASRSDWDQIGESFTAVRGVGYVEWYPVAMDSVSLSEGSRMSQVLGEWKERQAGAVMRLTLVVQSDLIAVTNGRLSGQKATVEEQGAVHQRTYEFAPMGTTPPAFAIAGYKVLSRSAINIFHLPGHEAAAQEYALAAEKLPSMLSDWFGPQQRKMAIVELPEGDAPFDSGPMLFTPLHSDRKAVEVALADQFVHAAFASRRLWIEEGLGRFAQALVRERQDGRKAALDYMQQFRAALAEAEQQARAPSQAGGTSAEGEPLVRTGDEIYYRWKAMFVWWMLRDIIGDGLLQRAISQYRAEDDKEPAYAQRLLEGQAKRSLEWFFDDWVYRDRGLPDFRVDSAFPRQLLADEVSVTVTVWNDGNAAAEVPVFVPVERGTALKRLQVPARGKAVTRISVPALPVVIVANDGSVPESTVDNNTFELKKPQ